MTNTFDSQTRAVGQGANARPPEPAALAYQPRLFPPTGIRQYLVILWDAAPGFALTLSTMISLILLAALAVLLMQELTKRIVTIQPISVHKELACTEVLTGCMAASRTAWRPL
jgi:hypothetical protein